jgi:hypothetical protein
MMFIDLIQKVRLVTTAVAGLLLLGAGCSGSPDLMQAAAAGAPISAQVTEQPDGTLHADLLLVQEQDDEDGRYQASGTTEFVQGRPALDPATGIYALLGLDVNPGPNAVPQDGVLFLGTYNGRDHFSATQVLGGTERSAMGGFSEGVVKDGADRWTITLMGRRINVDSDTRVVQSGDPLDPEELEEQDGDEQDDGVDCEQEGEHEGKNEGKNEGC